MSKKHVFSFFSLLIVLALVLTACTPPATPAPAATQVPAATQAPAATKAPEATKAPAATAVPTKAVEPTKAPAAAGPAVGGSLVVGITGDPYNLATWISNDLNASMLMNLVLPSLMVTDEKGNKVPYVMKEYKVSPDGKEYTVKLHEGIKWHDGKPLTAEDLVFTSQYVVKYKLSYGADMYADVAKAEVVDATTARFTLNNPSANFITQVGFWIDIMPKHIYENVTDPMNFQYNGVGYGPYKIKEFKKGEYYTLERVPDWPLANGGKGAYLETITFRIYPDPNALVLAMKNGEVQVSGSALPVAAQKQLEASPDQFGIQRVNSLGYGYFGLNYKNEFLKDVKVRTAIAMTIDRDALVNTAMQGGAIKMETPISPVYADLVKSQIKYPAFDVEGAKKILEDAGYKDTNKDGVREGPNGKPMEFELLMRSTTANVDAIANVFKANMEKAGMKVNIKIVEPATYTDRVTKQRAFDINAIDWGVIDDPDSSLATIYLSSASLNFMGYKNDKIDQLLLQAQKEPDYNKRIEIMNEFQKEFVKELPAINSWVRVNAYGYSKNYAGWSLTPGLYGFVDTKDLVKVYKVK